MIDVNETFLPDALTLFLYSFVYHNFQAVDQKMAKKSGKNTFICEITLKRERIEYNISAIAREFISLLLYPVSALINLI
jgi:hypothetical protein